MYTSPFLVGMSEVYHESDMTKDRPSKQRNSGNIDHSLKTFNEKYAETLKLFPKLSLKLKPSVSKDIGGDIRRCRSLQDVNSEKKQENELLQNSLEAEDLVAVSYPCSPAFPRAAGAKNIRELRRSSTPTPQELLSVTPLLQLAKRRFSGDVGHAAVKEEVEEEEKEEEDGQ